MDELSDTKIRNAKSADKEYTLADGQGLSVVVRPNGIRLWLYRYRFGGKRKNMSFGTFPGVGLKSTREKRIHQEECVVSDDAAALPDRQRSPSAITLAPQATYFNWKRSTAGCCRRRCGGSSSSRTRTASCARW